jgi:hypothetical protein
MTQAQAPLKQMSGEAVAKGVDRDFFLMPHWVRTAIEKVPDSTHGPGVGVNGLLGFAL